MTQGTTPTFKLTLPESVDLTEATNVYLTLLAGAQSIRKTGEELSFTAHEVNVYLSQAETVPLRVGSGSIQLNWTYPDGSRACSNIATVPIKYNLEQEVLE